MKLRGKILALSITLAGLSAPALAAAGGPLAGGTLGVDQSYDFGNYAYNDMRRSEGVEQALLAKIANQPRVRWYGLWSGTGERLTRVLSRYIQASRSDDPRKIVPVALFRQWPRGEGDRKALSPQDRADYRAWYDAAAAGIGDARAAVVLEPDLPLTTKRHRTADPLCGLEAGCAAQHRGLHRRRLRGLVEHP